MARILLVDDDAAQLFLFVLGLERAGHEVRALDSGLGFLEQVAIFKPDMILLDLAMSPLSGFDLVEQVRQSPDLAHLTVVAMTAYPVNDLPMDGDPSLFDGILAKPIMSLPKLIQPYLAKYHAL